MTTEPPEIPDHVAALIAELGHVMPLVFESSGALFAAWHCSQCHGRLRYNGVSPVWGETWQGWALEYECSRVAAAVNREVTP